MLILVKLFGVLITGLGLAIFASPAFSGKVFGFFKEGKRLYYAGVVRTVVGSLVLLAAPQSLVPVAAFALGVMFLVSGITVFACDLEKLKAFLVQYSEMPPLVVRLLGLIAATFGVIVFSIF